MKNYIKFKKCIDELIPDDKYFVYKGLKIINIKSLFLILKKKLIQKNIEKLFSDEILNSYFTSKKS